MPSYTPSTLATLRDRRLDGERQAERVLARALGARREAEAEAERLEARLEQARAALQASRAPGPTVEVESAAELQARRRFWSRHETDVGSASETLQRHRTGPLADAISGDEAARQAHLRARQRREVVEKAIARREAAGRRQQERRAETEIDDRARRR